MRLETSNKGQITTKLVVCSLACSMSCLSRSTCVVCELIVMIECLSTVTCSLATAYIAPEVVASDLMPLQQESELNQSESRANITIFIKKLLRKLHKDVDEAKKARENFSKGAGINIEEVWSTIVTDFEQLKNNFSQAIGVITTKLGDATSAISTCITASQGDADAVFAKASASTKTCFDTRIAEVIQYTESISAYISSASGYYEETTVQLNQCSESSSVLTIVPCLSTVALQTEVKVVSYASQLALMTAQLDIIILTLPTTFKICAAIPFIEAGLESAKIVIDIGACSAGSVYSAISSKHISDMTL